MAHTERKIPDHVTVPSDGALGYFGYKNGVYSVESVSLSDLAAKVGTPFYCYSEAALVHAITACKAAFDPLKASLHYAIKANSNQSVLKLMAAHGLGADVVSIGEVLRALAAGIPAERIVFSGVGKTRAELSEAIDLGLYQINVESVNELHVIQALGEKKNKRVPVALRINPDVDAHTVAQITTGLKGNKFGIDLCDALPIVKEAASLSFVSFVGLSVHIGSQMTDPSPNRESYLRLAAFVRQVRAEGVAVERLDLGGGIGIWYCDEPTISFAAFAELARETLGDLGCKLALEPGRSLVGNAGVLVATVSYVKQGADRKFLVLDASMNDLARPSLYGAYHHIMPVKEPVGVVPNEPCDIVGPICESTDVFAHARQMPPVADNDLVVFLSAGAYGSSMSAMVYNARPLVPEVLVSGSRYAVVRNRVGVEAQIAQEPIADWLVKG